MAHEEFSYREGRTNFSKIAMERPERANRVSREICFDKPA